MNHPIQIPDSEIKPKNIIPGSPEYVPHRRIKTTGKGKRVKNIKISSDMPCHKQTPTRTDRSKSQAKAHK